MPNFHTSLQYKDRQTYRQMLGSSLYSGRMAAFWEKRLAFVRVRHNQKGSNPQALPHTMQTVKDFTENDLILMAGHPFSY